MKLQQLCYLCSVVDHGFNIAEASQTLFTSQPGISKQIRQLERELGVEILARQGNRIIGLTEPGRKLVAAAQRLLIDSQELKKIAAGFSSVNSGSLKVATTHLHARYPLLPIISAFSKNCAPSLVRNALRKQTYQPRPIHNQKFGVPGKKFLCGSIVRSLELRSQASNKPAHVNDR